MAVRSDTYVGVEGLSILTVPDLSYRNIISVKREGLGYNIIESGTPGSRDVLLGVGTFEFLNPFLGNSFFPTTEDNIIEDKIFIVWDE